MTLRLRLPDPLALPPEEAAFAVRAELAHRAICREAALAAGRASFHALLAPLERSAARLTERLAPLVHANRVASDPRRRHIHDQLVEEMAARGARESGDPRLLAQVEAILDDASLTPAGRAVAEAWRLDLLAAGAGLDRESRGRLAAIERELARLELEYEYAVREAEDAFALALSEEQLPDLAPEERAPLAAAAREAGHGGLRIGLRAAEVALVLRRAPDRDLRERIYFAEATAASELGPGGGRFDNGDRLARILALRRERAALLRRQSPAHAVFIRRMAGDPEQALDFLRRLGAMLRPRAEAELAALSRFARERLGLDRLAPWDLLWVREHHLRTVFGIARERLRPCFPLSAVLEGVSRFLAERFGLRLERLAERAYPGAFWCLLRNADGEAQGALLCDLELRPGKQDGAWMDLWRPARGDTLPIAILVADALPAGGAREPCLSPEELLTLFHELGHALHALTDRCGWPSLAGPEGAPFDGMELPSMLLERLARSPEVLSACSRDPATGLPLPHDVCERLVAALEFAEAIDLLRQVELARFDLELHLDPEAAGPGRALAILKRVRHDTAILPVPAWDRLPMHFGHLFGGGYEAGYYGYLWAEGLARLTAPLLAAPDAGRRFIEQVLAPGEVEPLAVRLSRFLGQSPDPGSGFALA